MQPFVKLEKMLHLSSLKLNIFAHDNDWYLEAYTKYRPVLSTDYILALSLAVIFVLQAGVTSCSTLLLEGLLLAPAYFLLGLFSSW